MTSRTSGRQGSRAARGGRDEVVDFPVLAPNARIPAVQRAQLAAQLAARYHTGASIRELCAETGYSIGRVRGLLLDAEVTFRDRGGRPRRASTPRSS